MPKKKSKPAKKKQRVFSTLTDGLRERIKADPKRYKDSQLSGDALTYKHRVQGAAKARKIKAESVAHIGETEIPKDSEAYKLLEAIAKAKKMTVKQLIKKHPESIKEWLEADAIVMVRETEYLISDLNKLPRDRRIMINDGDGFTRHSKESAILSLQQLLMHCAALTNIFMLLYRVQYMLDGNIRFYCPEEDMYKSLILDSAIKSFLDDYAPEIEYVESERKTSDDEPDNENQ